MNHCEYQSLLSQYIDGQLDAQSAFNLEQHLPLCPQCRRELEQLKALRQLCLDLPEEDIPVGLHERILAEAGSTDAKKGAGRVRRAVIPLAAAVLIFLLSRGLPGLLNDKSNTMQENSRAENMLMAVPEESSNKTVEDMFTEDTKHAGSIETPDTAGAAEPEKDTAEAPADDIRATGETAAAGKTNSVSFAPNEETENGMKAEEKISGRFERPSYLKYGLIIALVVGLGLTMVRLMTKKK